MSEELKKPVPTVQEFRDTKKKKLTLQKIIVGFVFACALIAALDSNLATVPLTGIALWMAMHDNKE